MGASVGASTTADGEVAGDGELPLDGPAEIPLTLAGRFLGLLCVDGPVDLAADSLVATVTEAAGFDPAAPWEMTEARLVAMIASSPDPEARAWLQSRDPDGSIRRSLGLPPH